jgi:hypothetical protein
MEINNEILEDMEYYFTKFLLPIIFIDENERTMIDWWKEIEKKFPGFISYHYLQISLSNFAKIGLLDLRRVGNKALIKINQKGKEFKEKLLNLCGDYLKVETQVTTETTEASTQ